MSRWAMLSAAGYFVYRMAKQFVHRVRTRELQRLGPGTDMAKCPRCHTYVSQDTTLKTSVNGYTLRFCSPECLEAYRRDEQDIDAHAMNEGSRRQ